MNRSATILTAAVVALFVLGVVGSANAQPSVNGGGLIWHSQATNLSGTPNCAWWYGCSPTAAGMMLGYYDRNGYGGLTYDNLVPGGIAETNTYGNPSALINNIIASSGHISDFYSGGGDASGDDVDPPFHAFDCLADFMGTSQDSAGNSNGTTAWWYRTDNLPLTESDIYGLGPSYYESSGMYGIGEYLEYAGYDADVLYNQCIYGYDGIEAGFTLEQYKAEIDAGRPVLIQVDNHSMLGYGYIDGTDTIAVYDTWGPDGQNPGTMTWGGTYPFGETELDHFGVTVLTLVIPAPGAIVLGAIGLTLVGWLRRKRAL